MDEDTADYVISGEGVGREYCETCGVPLGHIYHWTATGNQGLDNDDSSTKATTVTCITSCKYFQSPNSGMFYEFFCNCCQYPSGLQPKNDNKSKVPAHSTVGANPHYLSCVFLAILTRNIFLPLHRHLQSF